MEEEIVVNFKIFFYEVPSFLHTKVESWIAVVWFLHCEAT
jgi:hypothetical protein